MGHVIRAKIVRAILGIHGILSVSGTFRCQREDFGIPNGSSRCKLWRTPEIQRIQPRMTTLGQQQTKSGQINISIPWYTIVSCHMSFDVIFVSDFCQQYCVLEKGTPVSVAGQRPMTGGHV